VFELSLRLVVFALADKLLLLLLLLLLLPPAARARNALGGMDAFGALETVAMAPMLIGTARSFSVLDGRAAV